MMERQKIPVVLCFNKEDIAEDEQIAQLERIYEGCGYPCVFTSALEEKNIETVKNLLKGKTTVIAGPSGVGKSSIINTVSYTHLDVYKRQMQQSMMRPQKRKQISLSQIFLVPALECLGKRWI